MRQQCYLGWASETAESAGHNPSSKRATVPATEFKARCLTLLEEVRETHQPLLVTRHGRPVVAAADREDVLRRESAEIDVIDDAVNSLNAYSLPNRSSSRYCPQADAESSGAKRSPAGLPEPGLATRRRDF